MRRDTLAKKTDRLVTRTGVDGGGVPPAPPPQRRPSLLQSQTFLQPEVKEAMLEKERQRVQAERNRIVANEDPSAEDESGEDVYGKLQAWAQSGEQVETASDPEPKQDVPAVISSYDRDLIELADHIDPSDLLVRGFVMTELDVVEDVLSISVKSLRKADLREIQEDVDDFSRGKPPRDDPEGLPVMPSMDSIRDFSDMRYLAQGILGINGNPLPGTWQDRFNLLEQLASPAYASIRREYTKFLEAVGLLFPDKATKERMDKLREVIKKAQAHP